MEMYENDLTIEDVDALMLLEQGIDPDAPRVANVGVFKGCKTLIKPVTYLGEEITQSDIQESLLTYYSLRDIGMPWQAFARGLCNIWNGTAGVLAENLSHAQELTLIDAKETVTEQITGSSHQGTINDGDTRYSNTPNQYLNKGEGASFNGLTDITQAQNTTNSDTVSNANRTLETDKGGNAFERWLELSAKNKNIVYRFFDMFKPLFKTSYVLSRRW